MKVEIALGDGVRIQSIIGTAGLETFGIARGFVNAAVDHNLSDVDILRLREGVEVFS